MKKTMIIVVSLMMALNLAAQSDKPCGATACDSQKVCSVAQQKARQITDRMAKAYDLDAQQQEKLYKLNLMAMSPRGMMCRNNRIQKPCGADKPQCGAPQGEWRKCGKIKPGRGGHNMSDKGIGYMKALKEIMTPEQFQAYRSDKAIERKMFGHKNFGKRQGMPATCGQHMKGRFCNHNPHKPNWCAPGHHGSFTPPCMAYCPQMDGCQHPKKYKACKKFKKDNRKFGKDCDKCNKRAEKIAKKMHKQAKKQHKMAKKQAKYIYN